jgi:hypothetical protein
MNDTLLIIIIGLFALAIGGLGYIRHRNRRVTDAQYKNLQRIAAVSDKVAYVTPKGREVFTSSRIIPAMLQCADAAWKLKDDALRHNGYSSDPFPVENAKVFILPSVRDYDAEGNYSPCFQTWIDPSDNYFNSDWDKMKGWKPTFWQRLLGVKNTHYILAAEWVIDVTQNIIAVAEYRRDWTNCRNAIFHGDEHCAIYRKDRIKYSETADHSSTGGHPILPCPEYNEPIEL